MGALAEAIGSFTRRLRHAAAEGLLARAARLYARADDETLKKAWRLLELAAGSPGARREARRMRYMLDVGHPGAEWARRISRDLHPRCARKFISNRFGTAWFLAAGKREEFEARHGFPPP